MKTNFPLRRLNVTLCAVFFAILGTCLASIAGAQAPSGDVVITANTTWPSASYSVTSLTVQNGAVLTIGGGSTVTVTGGVAVTGNSAIVLQGANTTAQVNGNWAGVGVIVNAASVQVDAGSSINADGQGYVAGAGPGSSASGFVGGSNGGQGGANTGTALNPTYGSYSSPVDLGSGGNVGCCNSGYGSSGGGAIQLTVSGTLTVNGTITANGLIGTGYGGTTTSGAGLGGAGGSINISADTLTGSGSIAATGGDGGPNGGGGGGGGRIAVHYTTNNGFNLNSITANGGTANYNGSIGTVYLIDANSNLTVSQNLVIPANQTLSFGVITVNNGSTLTIGGGSTLTLSGGLLVTGNSNVILLGSNTSAQVNGNWAGVGVTLSVGSVQVDAGSSINADGQGYVAGAGPGSSASGFVGGSYGGVGGANTGNTLNPTYGSFSSPVDLGSGGNVGCCNSGYGSSGGGAIQLTVSGTLTVNGTITANGLIGTGYGGVTNSGAGLGGAGGSINITAATLTGSGIIAATGGDGGPNGGGGGGGGRIAVHYTTNSGFDFNSITASGGTANYNGAPGTVFLVDAHNNVIIPQNLEIPANQTQSFGAMTVNNGASLTLGSGSYSTIQSLSSGVGSTVTIGGGATINVAQALHIAGLVTAQATNTTAQAINKWVGKGVTIVAGSVQIDATGSINGDGQGYVNEAGPGAGSYTTGGSYGGAGGGQLAGSVYGSATAPTDLGSGGGHGQNTGGGTGGGAIQLLVSGTLTDNGSISANGGSISQSGYGGGGSGGSIFIQAKTIQGTGSISADGGSNNSPGNAGSGGGGGRVSVLYLTNSGFSAGSISVAAGMGATVGSPGTINFVNAPGMVFLLPTKSVLHGATQVEAFSDFAVTASVTEAGPESSTLTTGSVGLLATLWDTTTVPDGVYELLLNVTDATGAVSQLTKNVVINNSVTWLSGALTANMHLAAGTVYVLDGELSIPSGLTLTVDPGVVIKALPGSEILVESGGSLIANGTADNPIFFTTFDDSSVGGNTDFNQGVSLPTPGEWLGVVVASGGNSSSNLNTFIRYAGNTLSATISADTTLLSTQVYEINGTLTVNSGVTLTIQPGTVIKFDSGAGISAQPGSAIIANGTLTQPIYFTSINDNSVGANPNGNTATSTPAPGDWDSIVINGASATFNHVQMQYGGGPVNANATLGMLEVGGNSTVTITNSIFAYSYYMGILTGWPGGGDTETIVNSTFYGIEDRAINAFGGSTVHVVNDTFDGNAQAIFTHGGLIDVANSIISNSTGTQYASVATCCGGTITSIVNTDVYTTAAGVSNYGGVTDPTGSAGNISANPGYTNTALHDYRPTYGSPAIDAGNGTVSNYPATDAFGIGRYNSPFVATKTGTPDSGGKYPDMGAFEFVQAAPSNLDLTVSLVQGALAATVGDTVQLTWKVTNIGSGTVYGPWHDAVYVVSDPSTNPVEVLAGQYQEGSGVILGPGASYSASATVTVPGVTHGPHSWQVKTNVRGEVFEGANTANNTGTAVDLVNITVPEILIGAGASSGTLAGTGQSAYFQITPTASETTSVQVALTGGVSGYAQVFVGAGYVPSPQHYDYQQIESNSTTASVVIPSGAAQTYYVTVYGQLLPAGAATFTIQATSVQFSLTSVSPGWVPGYGTETISFVGGGFSTSTVFSLVSPTGKVYNAQSVFISDATNADATFDLTNADAGSYTAQVTNSSTLALANAVQVKQDTYGGGFAGPVQVVMSAPQGFRVGFPQIVRLYYTNTSGYDIPAPLIYFSADNANLSELPPQCEGCDPNYTQKLANTFTSGIVLGINHDGPAGILPAGGSGTISFVANSLAAGNVTFYVSAVGIDPVQTEYVSIQTNCNGPDCVSFPKVTGAYGTGAEFCATLTPEGTSDAGMSRSCMALLNNGGFNYIPATSYVYGPIYGSFSFDGFNQLLATNATALSQAGDYEFDIQKLLAYELQKDGFTQISQRYHQGAYGYGASHPFDIVLSTASDVPTVLYPNGAARVFATPAPAKAGTFLGAPGDYATMTNESDGSWLLTEANGTLYHFNTGTTNTLDYIQDHAGNRVTVSYTNGLATSVTDSFGNTMSYQYDTLGHITQQTDFAGHVSTYTYDVLSDTQHSSFLTSITNPYGTTTIQWNEGGAHGVGYMDDSCVTTYCEPAIGISSVTFPDGTHTYYTYDAIGRIATTSRDGGTEAVTFNYAKDGSFTVTDATGKSITNTLSTNGWPILTTDARGARLENKFDVEGKLIESIGPLGDSSSINYDQLGNLTNLTTPAENLTSFGYTNYQNLVSLTDPSGYVSGFTYDADYNMLAAAAANGEQTTFTYNSNGRPVSKTNRRGRTISYAYGVYGLLTSKTLPNGTQILYGYDSHFNLQSVTAANGVTSYTHDGADRLTGVSYPGGTSITIAYNAKGQRSRLQDSTGFVTNYSYDAAGRLAGLTNGSGANIVTYSYDASGRLVNKAFGNGTSTALSYDAAGNVASVIHSNASHAVLSEYDYAYDLENHLSTEKNPSGNFTYSYDLDGQLTTVNTPSGTVQYAYDPSGNRTSVTTNGISSAFEANNLDQYTLANGAAYQYDADGNLIQGNGWSYSYDDENKLVAMANASDSWTFQYDGLGNRIASVQNGTVRHYLIDPSDLGNVEAELDSNGAVVAHYVYGLDLASSVQSSGASGYYHFDAAGNTVQVTGATGAVANSYTYLPFGEQNALATALHNPFTYNGKEGVVDDGSGLYFMRNRWYNPQLGRFLQIDPLGIEGGRNLYAYVANNPLRRTDPLGLSSDPFYDFGNSPAGRFLNAVSGEGEGLSGFAAGSASNILTIDSFGHAAGSHDTLGMIHDGTLAITRQAGLFINQEFYDATWKLPGPLKYLLFTIKHIGAIDEGSKLIFNYWQDPDGDDPDLQPGAKAPKPKPPCGGCLFKPNPGQKVPVNSSTDPNAKIASGFGDQGYIPVGQPVTYTIFFENQATATAPAQKVVVTDSLSNNLDWSTVALNEIAFNDFSVSIPDGVQTYTAQATVSTDPNPVNITAALNPTSGLLTWSMQSVDPVTGATPADPLAGFLPPNNSANAGAGYVTFTVAPKKGLANATVITNQASIIFDANAAIQTNTVTNTIDSSTVTSSVNSLPSSTTNNVIPLSWSGSDPSGSGIAFYSIYVEVDGGSATLWLSATTLTSSSYTAAPGHTYSFYSLATNNVGLSQVTPVSIQTIVVNYLAPTVTVTPASTSISLTQSLNVSVAVTAPNPVTGSVVLSGGGYTSSAVTLTSGVASFVIPAGALAGGVDTLTATFTPDTAGAYLYTTATGTATVTVGSSVIQITVGASGASFSVDGTTYSTPQTFSWTLGTTHTLATTSPQTSGGVQQTFTSWSDGGAISHSVTASSSTTSYTAAFSVAYQLTTASAPTSGGSVSPTSAAYYAAGSTVSVTATPATGYSFAGWTGAVADSTTASTTIAMTGPQTVTANFTLTPLPVLTLTPTTLSFTSVAGTASATQTAQLQNTGTAVLNLNSVMLTGASPSEFSLTNGCGSTLASGATCNLTVGFTSATRGTFSASVSIADNATGSPQTVALSGTAIAPPTFTLTATPASQTVTAGTDATFTIHLASQGGAFSNPVILTATVVPTGLTATFQPASVTPGAAGANSVLTIHTLSKTASLQRPGLPPTALAFTMAGLFGLLMNRRRRRLMQGWIALLLLGVICSLSACGGPSSASFNVTITGTSGTTVESTSVQLTIR